MILLCFIIFLSFLKRCPTWVVYLAALWKYGWRLGRETDISYWTERWFGWWCTIAATSNGQQYFKLLLQHLKKIFKYKTEKLFKDHIGWSSFLPSCLRLFLLPHNKKKTPAEINSLKWGAGDGIWKKVDYHRGRLSCVRIGGRMKWVKVFVSWYLFWK